MAEEIEGLNRVVKSTINSIKEGIKGSNYTMPLFIEFELAIASTEEGSGGLRVYVANLGGKLATNEISKINNPTLKGGVFSA